jgi:hypothetical protein
VLTTAQVILKVRRSNPAAAGGLSGTTYKTLRSWFFAEDPTSDALTAVLNLIVRGEVPPSIVPLLNAGRGIAVPKNEKGDLRPIVIGHVLLRLLGSLALTSVNEKSIAFFLKPKPLQFGVGVASGCELVAAAISAHLELNPNHIDCALDAKNAFNSWCRSRMWQPLLDHFPSIFSLVKLMYGDLSSVLFHEPGSGLCEIMNSVGCKQGCSLGSFLFSLAIHGSLSKLQAEFKDLLIIAYCDDVHIVGDPVKVAEAYQRWAYLYGKDLQGELRSDKSKVFAPSQLVTKASLVELGFPSDIMFSQDGTRVLGAPIGSDSFKASFASTTVDAILDDLNALALMPSSQSQHLITTKSIAHRINHLLRNIPGGELDLFGAIELRYDDALLLVPQRICHQISLGALPRLLCSLPLSDGGLGYRTWGFTSDPAFLASYTHISHNFKSLFPQYASQYPAVQTITSSNPFVPRQAFFAARALARLRTLSPSAAETVTAPPPSMRQLQHALSTSANVAYALRATVFCHTIDAPDHPRHAAVYHSNCGDVHTFATIPTDADTTFTNSDFAVITARRLLLQITQTTSEKRRCQNCKASTDEPRKHGHTILSVPEIDPYGDHQIRCATRKGGHRARSWHDPLARMLHRVGKAANIASIYEPSAFMVQSNQRPDVVFYPDSGRAVVTDCRTNDPTLAGNCRKCAETPGHANDTGTTEKNKKWLPTTQAQNDVFLPFCIEVGGRMSPASLDFLRSLSFAAGGTPSDQAAFLMWSLQRIHCTTQRGIARMIQACPVTRSDSHVLPFGGLVPLGLPPPPLALRRAIPPRPPIHVPHSWHLQAALALPTPPTPLPTTAPPIPILPHPSHFLPTSLFEDNPDLSLPESWPPQSPIAAISPGAPTTRTSQWPRQNQESPGASPTPPPIFPWTEGVCDWRVP